MVSLIDKIIVWSFCGGIWFLIVTLINKDITTSGTIGSAIAVAAGLVGVYLARPLVARFARYQLFLLIILVWGFTIYLVAH